MTHWQKLLNKVTKSILEHLKQYKPIDIRLHELPSNWSQGRNWIQQANVQPPKGSCQ